jgi:hypothetical protein
MDIAHQGERMHTIHKAERPHEERELKKNADKTNQKRSTRSEI